MAQLELLDGISRVQGVPVAREKHLRRGDYTLTLKDGSKVAADLYECSTEKADNAAEYIGSKWDQADTVIVLLQEAATNKSFAAQVIKALYASRPSQVRPRRVMFFAYSRKNDTYNSVEDHRFKDAQPQKKWY
jgi:hypothetical protein